MLDPTESPVRVAILGAGHWGPNLISNFHRNERSRVAWVVDPDPARLEEVAQRFEGLEICSDPDGVLTDADVDAVVIATPTRTHFELARRALEAGKHVLVEKPIADSVGGAVALRDLGRQVDRVLMVGHVFVYNSAARFVKRCIREGELGRLYYLSMVRTNLGPIRVDVNAAWDLAAHDISLASYWLDADPLAVSARGGTWINPGVEDAVFATLRYPGDVLVHLHASWLNPRKARDITVVGDARMLTFDDVAAPHPVHLYDKQVLEERGPGVFVDSFETFRTMVQDGQVVTPEIAHSEPLRNECEHFLDCILEGAETESGAEEGLAVVRALDAISRSLAESGREVPVEP